MRKPFHHAVFNRTWEQVCARAQEADELFPTKLELLSFFDPQWVIEPVEVWPKAKRLATNYQLLLNQSLPIVCNIFAAAATANDTMLDQKILHWLEQVDIDPSLLEFGDQKNDIWSYTLLSLRDYACVPQWMVKQGFSPQWRANAMGQTLFNHIVNTPGARSDKVLEALTPLSTVWWKGMWDSTQFALESWQKDNREQLQKLRSVYERLLLSRAVSQDAASQDFPLPLRKKM